MLTVNSKFYVSKTVSGIPDGGGDIMQEAKDNMITDWDIYFVKPDFWSDDVCAYIYYLDKDKKVKELEKWPGKLMRREEDYYTLSYEKKWYGKARVIIVDKNNPKNRFPEESSAGIVLEGNLNVTPNNSEK